MSGGANRLLTSRDIADIALKFTKVRVHKQTREEIFEQQIAQLKALSSLAKSAAEQLTIKLHAKRRDAK